MNQADFGADVEVIGADTLHRTFRQAVDVLDELPRTMRDGPRQLMGRMHPPRRTGALARSLRAGVDRKGQGFVEARSPYAGYVEYGTRHMRGRPFMRPVARDGLPTLLRIAQGEADDALDAVRGAY